MLGIIYGGESLEHEVSVESAKDVLKSIKARSFYIDKKGRWEVDGEYVENPAPLLKECTVVFPLIHGACGENGTLQGFIEMLSVPYIGCDVVSSAVCMDKDFTKRIVESYGIATTPFQTFYSLEDAIAADIKAPCVVKSTSLGSSFGIYKVTDDPKEALKKAFDLGPKVLVEKTIEGREIWCSVFEDGEELFISSPCEIIPKGGFFSYEGKYSDAANTEYHVPVKNIDEDAFIEIATQVFRYLGCKDIARIDFFLTDGGEILLNEVNTVPGFTSKSLFSKALINDGYTYEEILNILVQNNVYDKTPIKNVEEIVFL